MQNDTVKTAPKTVTINQVDDIDYGNQRAKLVNASRAQTLPVV